ncbi:MAG: DUF3592 domain-containing protein [Anaerolineae bacterium]|nr:DUF3592 domain-containing protein [Anaerolineae bacterium]
MQTENSFRNNIGGCFQTMFFFLIFLLVGAGLSWWGWTILQNARASADWPSVEGRVTSSLVDYSTDSDGGDSYSPKVTYVYVANDLSYESRTIKFGENSYGSERKAQEITSRYPEGQAVTVFYDPANPDKAVLEPGVSSGSYIVLGIGALFVLIALFVPIFIFIRFVLNKNN